ncbi:MAG TPA: trypsin-like peptidase domain-containing protein [Gammaproteobacteria bacterium]|nr:trypsin-like peptidase domain-containing protein [Gammaproteobacteria bacterium]
MITLRKVLIFLLQSAVVGLAAAFVVVLLEPELLQRAPAPLSAPETASSGPVSYAQAVQRSAPAVVNINTAKHVPTRANPVIDDPLIQRFFGEQAQRTEDSVQTTLGSGVIVSADGYVLTNNHVIAGAEEIQVTLRDGRSAQARLVGSDPETDLALLKIDLADVPVITLGRSDTVAVGDVVLAIGNPYGFGQTVTQGIVSATGRSQLGLSVFENYIQTDAAINLGNSGGALVNTRGELIGINTAMLSRNGETSGIGFAVPVNLARGVMEQLIRHGRVIRGWLGIQPQDLTPDLAEAFGLAGTTGIVVRDVIPHSPAEEAGLRRGDTITHINGEPVTNERDALNRIASKQPGTKIEIRGIRTGTRAPFTAQVTVGERRPRNG